ncbi:MAG: hypothetical protein P8N58_05285 [Emcibacteraceae bacterium]|nr:hypothetical protein [Emcibacteraceae bacterium]
MIDEERIKALFDNDRNILFVAAYGSYSRGEEAYVLGEDGISRLYNDFDMVVVVKNKKLFITRLKHYQMHMTQIVDGAQVDFLVLDKPLSFMQKSTIWYNDFRFTKKIFCGDLGDMEFYFGDLKARSIWDFDVYAMFVTRSWAAGCLSVKLVQNPYTMFYKRYQAAKLVIATVDFYLLTCSKYETLLNKKLSALKLIDDDFAQSLVPKFIAAVQVKLSPATPPLSMLSINEESFDEYLSDYNRAFSAYLSSKTFASDTMLKIFMTLKYLKALFFFKDKVVVDVLRNRNLIASLVRAHSYRGKITNYSKKMAERFL